MTVGRSRSPTHQKGAKAEDTAALFLQQQGYALIAQNFNSRCGEIDLIVRIADKLIFVEVRQRKVASLVSAFESVTLAKQRKIIKTAQFFLQQHRQYQTFECRFDVIACTPIASSTVNSSVVNSPLAGKSSPATMLSDVDTLRPIIFQDLKLEWIQAAFMASRF